MTSYIYGWLVSAAPVTVTKQNLPLFIRYARSFVHSTGRDVWNKTYWARQNPPQRDIISAVVMYMMLSHNGAINVSMHSYSRVPLDVSKLNESVASTRHGMS